MPENFDPQELWFHLMQLKTELEEYISLMLELTDYMRRWEGRELRDHEALQAIQNALHRYRERFR